MASDFHSHRRNGEIRTLLSCCEPEGLCSFQAHPWQAGIPLQLPDLSRFAALGETGLDKCKGPPLPVQQKRFISILEAAEKYHKSVVIHCVKAWAELLEIRKNFPNRQWLIHGFRGSPELLEQLRKQNFFLSLGRAGIERLLHPGFSLYRIGFETDDSSDDLRELLRIAAAKLQISCRETESITDKNFEEFLCLNDSNAPCS